MIQIHMRDENRQKKKQNKKKKKTKQRRILSDFILYLNWLEIDYYQSVTDFRIYRPDKQKHRRHWNIHFFTRT